MNKILLGVVRQALVQAGLAGGYVLAIALFLSNAERIFGEHEKPNTFGVAFMLLLLVVSVAFMGVVIFGKPVMWYLDHKRREAIELVFFTIVFLCLFAGAVFVLFSRLS